jgi:peptide/nickel transport system permease protein
MVSKSGERVEPVSRPVAGGATGVLGQGRLDRAAVKKSPGYLVRSWRRFRRNRLSMVALVFFIRIVLFSYGAPLISAFVTHQDYESQNLLTKFAKPGATVRTLATTGPNAGKFVMVKHWLGSDELGRDVLTRLAYGGRISLSVAFITMALALTVGLLVGVTAGYYGGWADSVLMRLVDIFISIPGLFVLILISTMVNNNKLITNSPLFKSYGWLVLPFVIAALSWTTISRLIRGEFLAIKGRDYVEAARVLGAKDSRIIFRHILPNVLPIIIVWASLVVPGLILLEAALSYLGFGVQIPTPSWGNMLSNSQQYFTQAAFLVVIPGLAIFLTVLMVNLMSNGLRDALDPRLND